MSGLIKYGIFIFLILLANCCYAQIFYTGLADPVVNITFGSGHNITGAPVTSSTYAFSSSPCPPTHSYAIVKNNVACSGSTWTKLYHDHTFQFNNLDTSGYMMIVNASSFSPEIYYADTVRNLCDDVTYLLSTWVSIIGDCDNDVVLPNLGFTIETVTGAIIKTVNFGDADLLGFDALLKSVGFYFTLPAGTHDIVFKLVNARKEFGGCGNQLALDDIQLRPVGPAVKASLSNSTGLVKSLCFLNNDLAVMNCAVDEGYANPAFQWQQSADSGFTWNDITDATKTSYQQHFSTPGTFLFKVRVAEDYNIPNPACSNASNIVKIIVDSIPDIKASNNSPLCAGSFLQFKVDGGATYNWTGPNGFAHATPYPGINNVSLKDTGTYYVQAASVGGCVGSDSTSVTVIASPVIQLPDTVTVCKGSQVQLQANGGDAYIWSPATNLSAVNIANPYASPAQTTAYLVKVSNTTGCSSTATEVVSVQTKPAVSVTPESASINEGETVQLKGVVGNGVESYYWSSTGSSMQDSLTLTPTVMPLQSTIYTLHIHTSGLCDTASATSDIHVYQKVFIPNAFTPNNDGKNDKWMVKGLDSYPDADINIYDRYGQMIFHSKGYTSPWNGYLNGLPLPQDTYIYTINLNSKSSLLTGTIVLLR